MSYEKRFFLFCFFLNRVSAVCLSPAAAGLSLIHIYIDTDHGSSRYEIEFTAGGYEYDYEVDCMSGEILKFEKDKIR